MKPHEWIIGRDTGISSKTIWAVMMNAVPKYQEPFQFDVPKDPSDFGRCYRLLEYFPEWKKRLNEVSDQFPKWKPLIREWTNMTKLYERDVESGNSKELFDLMQDLNWPHI